MTATHTEIQRSIGLRCEMSDGVELVADAWHPRTGGPWPVLLQRLPYGRSVASTPTLPHPSRLAAHGYLVVVQDVRGRGDSGGTFEPFVDEADDGFAAIEWAARLPESNGDVATYGFSYQGLNQLYAAARRPPSLRAIAPMMGGADPYEGWLYEGGCLRWPFVCFWAAQLAGQEGSVGPLAYDIEMIPPIDAHGADPPPWFLEWLAHPDDDSYWERRRPDLERIEVPSFVVAGWFDDFSSSTLTLAAALGSDLTIGPWSHMPWGSRAGDVELGPGAGPGSVSADLIAFFDRVLKGEGERDPLASKVRFYTGGRGWESAAAWPLSTGTESWFGYSEGNANSRHGDGRLALTEPGRGEFDVIVAQPHHPYPGTEDPLSDEGPAEDRRDVCCYTSDPLADDRVLTGAPTATITTRCDRASHDIVVSLVLVDGDGLLRRLATGVRRLPSAEPGGVRVTTIDLRAISWVLAAGSQLRLDVSAARSPMFDRNPHNENRPGPEVPESEMRVATVEILAVEVSLPLR